MVSIATTPPAPSIVEPLWNWATHSLQNHLYENATFLAERIVAESSCDASKLLLATCHYMSGAANRAAHVLQGSTAPQNRYMLALCCMRLGRLPEAQNALLGASMPDTDASATLPNGAAGLYLMGTICLKMQQRQRAIKYLTRCLGLNPFMWSAYEALSQLGAALPEGLVAPPLPAQGSEALVPIPVPAIGPESALAASGYGPGASGAAPATPMVTPGIRTPIQPSFTPINSGIPPSASAIPASAAPPPSDSVRVTAGSVACHVRTRRAFECTSLTEAPLPVAAFCVNTKLADTGGRQCITRFGALSRWCESSPCWRTSWAAVQCRNA